MKAADQALPDKGLTLSFWFALFSLLVGLAGGLIAAWFVNSL
jgi:hypothetical protein